MNKKSVVGSLQVQYVHLCLEHSSFCLEHYCSNIFLTRINFLIIWYSWFCLMCVKFMALQCLIHFPLDLRCILQYN